MPVDRAKPLPTKSGVPEALRIVTRVRPAEFYSRFEAVFRGNYPRLVGILSVACGDRDLAAELVEQAFVALWINWDRACKYENPSAWVTKVAINRLHNHRRSLRRRAVALLRLEHEPEPPTVPPAAGLDLAAALKHLPMRQRLAVVLHYLDDRPIPEIAHVMGISEGAVNSHLHRARETLRSLLGEA
jgi:RNA polymerase sigma-70 factor (ECF subfamily)